mmetsp:Transcript_37969/g.89763  ORF Transcript_37969/g.89763 Transcript_37969/m.89763 type:complete len:259 (+) Transcript_37969:775-1551(+)
MADLGAVLLGRRCNELVRAIEPGFEVLAGPFLRILQGHAPVLPELGGLDSGRSLGDRVRDHVPKTLQRLAEAPLGLSLRGLQLAPQNLLGSSTLLRGALTLRGALLDRSQLLLQRPYPLASSSLRLGLCLGCGCLPARLFTPQPGLQLRDAPLRRCQRLLGLHGLASIAGFPRRSGRPRPRRRRRHLRTHLGDDSFLDGFRHLGGHRWDGDLEFRLGCRRGSGRCCIPGRLVTGRVGGLSANEEEEGERQEGEQDRAT